jgi:hypothetical protein
MGGFVSMWNGEEIRGGLESYAAQDTLNKGMKGESFDAKLNSTMGVLVKVWADVGVKIVNFMPEKIHVLTQD